MIMHYFHSVLECGLPPSLNLNHNTYSTLPRIHVRRESMAAAHKGTFQLCQSLVNVLYRLYVLHHFSFVCQNFRVSKLVIVCCIIIDTKMKNFYRAREPRDMTIFGNSPWHNEVRSIYITISMKIPVQNQQKLYFLIALVMVHKRNEISYDYIILTSVD